MDMFSLKDKIAVITGGGSGIGRAIAVLFAGQGAIVHILERDRQASAEVLLEISRLSRATAYSCDVADRAAVLGVFESIGRVDILVNNAGIAHVGTVETTSEEDFERVYQVNVKGAYNCLCGAIPQMKRNGGGVILNTASIASHVGIADRFAYSMSKGAIHAMSMSVARDYLADNIRCNSISPARWINHSKMTPLYHSKLTP